MAVKPILFNTEMVQAILAGRKTQTRRVIKDNNVCRPYEPGDILWVRKTWSTTDKCGLFPRWPSTGTHYMYKADNPDCEPAKLARWFPSIHMPKEAARIFLRVKDVRVERLQDIKNYECVDEGAVKKPNITKRGDLVLHNRYKEEFARLWDSTIKPTDHDKYGWEANPWVWVIEFERCEKPEGWPV